MMSMSRRFATPLFLALLWGAGALGANSAARAGVLYRCEGPNGSIAYTNKAANFTKCSEVSRYADAPVKKATRHAVSMKTPAAPTALASNGKGWEYRENVHEQPDVKAASSGVTSTAMPLRATESGVESTALLIRTTPLSLPVANMIASAEPAEVAPAKPLPKILRSAVYRVQRAGGITEYTNVKPASGASFAVLFTYIATCIACDVHSKIDFARTALNLDAFKDEIAAAAASTGVDVALLRAVIHAESAFNPMALSNKGAQGLMQLMPDTAGDLGVNDAFDVAQNIGGGAKYLAQLLKDFNGNTQLATAAYNAGEGAVQKYGGVPPYDETQVYVQRVEQLRDRYKKAL
ncbi:MAG TPA: lytic transglycosylase domain-containing protein [Rhodanobacteraceae bacterium]|nr:lytic transglycosylase domain-containing protein [Rhodanobacteraceae bacterium]